MLDALVAAATVATTYSLPELTSDWKLDIGASVRAMVAGGVIRLCYANSEEGSSVWVMVGQPF